MDNVQDLPYESLQDGSCMLIYRISITKYTTLRVFYGTKKDRMITKFRSEERY